MNYMINGLISDPFKPHQIMQPLMPLAKEASHAPNSSHKPNEMSRIIPIKVERGVGAFNDTTQHGTQTRQTSNANAVEINDLEDLKVHQAHNKAEESIRGYSKPKVIWIEKG